MWAYLSLIACGTMSKLLVFVYSICLSSIFRLVNPFYLPNNFYSSDNIPKLSNTTDNEVPYIFYGDQKRSEFLAEESRDSRLPFNLNAEERSRLFPEQDNGKEELPSGFYDFGEQLEKRDGKSDSEISAETRGIDNNEVDLPLGVPDSEDNVPGEPLTPQDFINANKIEILAPVLDESSPDPILVAGLFEGDIAGINSSFPTRNAIRNAGQRWTGGVIPYAISAAFNIYERSVIAAAFQDYQKMTCIRFVPRTTQRDHVYIVKGSGCSSIVGRNGAGQQVSLGPGCVFKGVVIHELMHAVGFWHEQSRPDRDKYVTVLWQNIIRGMEYNFNKFSWDTVQALGVDYDTSSVMHYTRSSFSKDGRSPTIIPKQPGVQFIGQRVGFSDKDIQKLNRLYRCKETGLKPVKPGKPPIDQKCADNHHMCSYWAGIGECLNNPPWMLVNCRQSCKQCSEKCGNYNKDCKYWAEIGECTKNPSYMTIYCAAACRTCVEHSQSGPECTDTNANCPEWAADSQCLVNPNYMLRHCAKSCSQCV